MFAVCCECSCHWKSSSSQNLKGRVYAGGNRMDAGSQWYAQCPLPCEILLLGSPNSALCMLLPLARPFKQQVLKPVRAVVLCLVCCIGITRCGIPLHPKRCVADRLSLELPHRGRAVLPMKPYDHHLHTMYEPRWSCRIGGHVTSSLSVCIVKSVAGTN